MNRSVLQTIRNGMDTFSKGQKRIANYILENYDKAAFMTASKLGQTAQVSESTVVRFAAELGYNGYPDMQKELQELIRGKLTSIQRIQVSSDQMSGGDILGSVMQRDMNSIHDIIEELDRDEFERVVDKLLHAKHIYILGVRSSSFLAGYLNFYMHFIFENVTLVPATPRWPSTRCSSPAPARRMLSPSQTAPCHPCTRWPRCRCWRPAI